MTAALGHRVLPSPLGPLTLVGVGETLHGVYYPAHRPAPPAVRVGPAVPGILETAAAQILAYLAGERDGFALDTVAAGTPFQRAVWAAIAAIPRGVTRSYRELAHGLPGAVHPRAVGGAVGANRLSIVVPCHRVLGASGALTGYAGGIERKGWLLTLEGVTLR